MSVPDTVKAMNEAAHKWHVKPDDPLGIFVQSLGNAMLALDGEHEKLRALISSQAPISRVDAKITLLSVMMEAKSEFLKILAKQCTPILVSSGAAIAATFFLLGHFL